MLGRFWISIFKSVLANPTYDDAYLAISCPHILAPRDLYEFYPIKFSSQMPRQPQVFLHFLLLCLILFLYLSYD